MNDNGLCLRFVVDFPIHCQRRLSNRTFSMPGRGAGTRRIAAVFLIAVGMLGGTNARAATYTVANTADSGTGSLRAAITAANGSSGNTINLSGISGTITLASTLPAITQSMTITGPGANTLTISGNNAYQILYISSGTVTISGLTFANGNGHGGDAGAIFTNTALTLMSSTFSGNSGDYGGAVTSYGAMTVMNCTFSGNTAVNGGGAINSNVTLDVINSTFSGNFTTDAIAADGAYGGGAILSFGTSMTVTNSTFSGNSTTLWGGAIYAYSGGSTLTANDNIFIGNSSSAPSAGAAITATVGTSNASYNLFYQNLNGSGAENDCDGCTSNTNAITGSNPDLLPLGYYGGPTETMLPQPGSPAICAGSYANVPNGTTTDQRGFLLSNSTCNNGGVDVGAVQSDYVQVTNTNDSGAGSLRAIITAANATSNGGDIYFAPGVTGTITLASALPAITQGMVIMGPGASTLIISGNKSYQILNIGVSSTVFISGLTLANGNSGQTSFGGGAIYNGGTLTVTDSVFSGNSGNSNSGGGAGGAIDNNGVLTITNCTFSGNSSLGSGAIQAYGTATIIGSSFIGNTGTGGGGAIDINGATTTVANSTFSGNSSTGTSGFGGGAIDIFGGTATVVNSTFSGNSSASRGGAIYNFNGAMLTAANNIFAGNTVTNSYGGAGISTTGNTYANYNLFYQNLDAGGAEDDCSGCTTNTSAITGSNPLLAALGSYGGLTQTMLLQPGSPAICSGSTAFIPTGVNTDQRGFNRTTTYNSITCVDLGAVQTDYTSVAFASSSYSGVVGQSVNPTPVVTVTENGQNIGGVPVTLGYSGTGSPTGLGPRTTAAGTGASFSNLTAPSVADGTLTVSLPITALGNSVQPAALTASATLNIDTTAQTITFLAASPVSYGSAPITLVATGGASGNPVTFSLDPTSSIGAATLTGSILTVKGVGTVVIDANQAAGSGYLAAAQVQQKVVVNPASLTITASSPAVTYGSAVPTITPIFGTFFNGDTSAVLTQQPTCVTAYTITSAVGSSPSTSCSGAAASNYTFTYVNGSVTVNPAPTFAVGGGSASISIAPGATTGNTAAITVTPSGGFTGTVNLTCSISPVAANDPPGCSLSPASVTITGTGAQNSTLTITSTASTVSENQLKRLLWPVTGTALALVLMIGVPRRRRGLLTMLGVLALSTAVGAIGCGGSGGSHSGGGNSGTTAGTYTVTVTGTSGSVTGTVGTITLVVQ